MAVLVEAYCVIIQHSTLNAKYPGGVEAYASSCPNGTYCSDQHLARVAFMARRDADLFVARLAVHNITPYRAGHAEDVALVGQQEGAIVPCEWIQLGECGGARCAWLAGFPIGDLYTPQGWTSKTSLGAMSAPEIKERLELARRVGGVDVYRDKLTGQEYFVGRTESCSKEATVKHDQAFKRAGELSEELILLDNLDASAAVRLEKAAQLYEEAVSINPANWTAMWHLGKIYQSLEDDERALSWLARSHRVNPDQPEVAREAAIAAMDVGRHDEAVVFCKRAIEAKPNDAGLQANLALALLFSGNASEARPIAENALCQCPTDEITRNIIQIIREVLAGDRPCPHHVRDLE